MSEQKAALVLEDGTVFDGRPFGHAGEAHGVAVFYTGVVGYQELLTNPSYRGQVAVLTYPIIGSYGVNDEDNESPGVHPVGLVVREYSAHYSNFRATGALEDFLKSNGVVGIREVDTRAVAVHLRERGEMQAAVVSGTFDTKEIVANLKESGRAPARDLAAEVTWEGERAAKGKATHALTVLNLGVKESLLGQLADLGCSVRILRSSAGADAVVATKPQGVVLAGGPGDPRVLDDVVETVKGLVGAVPLLGIGLGHQVLALALGCGVERMKTGHRGVNYPVKDLTGGPGAITAQHHSYVVAPDSVPAGVQVTHVALNDETVEGIASETAGVCGIQFHPVRDEMEQPSPALRRFCESL
ncbi:MAG TPA: glutamine-hydrolyzing carbamoyl-phosphate synthase small subunit [Phycisphaerae bacterium]|nr:glutamine-hydrolyzing carbamoyl-phosphate synthase small subunit [Phycisphaerae bacterium]